MQVLLRKGSQVLQLGLLAHEEILVFTAKTSDSSTQSCIILVPTRPALWSGLHIHSEGIFTFLFSILFLVLWMASCRSCSFCLHFCNHSHVLPDLARTREQRLNLKVRTLQALIFRNNTVSLPHRLVENLSFTKYTRM